MKYGNGKPRRGHQSSERRKDSRKAEKKVNVLHLRGLKRAEAVRAMLLGMCGWRLPLTKFDHFRYSESYHAQIHYSILLH